MHTILFEKERKERMKRHDGHALAYSNGFSAVYLFSLLKAFDHSATIICNLFTNTHQKFDMRRMDEFYGGIA